MIEFCVLFCLTRKQLQQQKFRRYFFLIKNDDTFTVVYLCRFLTHRYNIPDLFFYFSRFEETRYEFIVIDTTDDLSIIKPKITNLMID